MQIVIDIPEKRYKDIIRISTIQAYSDYYPTYERIIANGTPIPDNATNGEVIKAMFPKIDDNFSNVIDLKLWWNAPYQKGGNVE